MCVCVSACVYVSHGVNHCGGAIKAYQTPVELPSCGRLSPQPLQGVSEWLWLPVVAHSCTPTDPRSLSGRKAENALAARL